MALRVLKEPFEGTGLNRTLGKAVETARGDRRNGRKREAAWIRELAAAGGDQGMKMGRAGQSPNPGPGRSSSPGTGRAIGS